jgi:hypothetical protein
MYVLPRAMESAWLHARSTGYVPRVPMGGLLLNALSMGVILDTYMVSVLAHLEATSWSLNRTELYRGIQWLFLRRFDIV